LPEVSEVKERGQKINLGLLERKKPARCCRWTSFWGTYTNETDDSIKKAANKTSADNIAESILFLYLVTQPRK
jgi:hypothetical protein